MSWGDEVLPFAMKRSTSLSVSSLGGRLGSATELVMGNILDVGFWLSRMKASLISWAVVSFTTSLMVLESVFCFAISITRRVIVIPLEGPKNLDSSPSLNLMRPAPRTMISASGGHLRFLSARASFSSSSRMFSRNFTIYVRDMVWFLAGSKYTHFALLRWHGSHRGIPGSHLDFL